MERQGLDPAEMSGASDGQMNGSAGTGQNTGMTAQVQQDNSDGTWCDDDGNTYDFA